MYGFLKMEDSVTIGFNTKLWSHFSLPLVRDAVRIFSACARPLWHVPKRPFLHAAWSRDGRTQQRKRVLSGAKS